MDFLRPWMLLIALVLISLLVVVEQWYMKRFRNFVFPKAMTDWRKWKLQEAVLIFSVFVLAGVTLAGPYVMQSRGAPGLCAIFVLDVSRSMGADDYTGETRFERAKKAVRELVKAFPDGEAGFIPFAGDAEIVVYRTTDLEDLAEEIDETEIESTKKSGSDLSAAFQSAVELVDLFQRRVREGRGGCAHPPVILLSDGTDEDDLITLEPYLNKFIGAGIPVVVAGLGTTEGTTIKINDKSFQTALNELTLKTIAERTAGKWAYQRIVTGSELVHVFSEHPQLLYPAPPRRRRNEIFYIPLGLTLCSLAAWVFMKTQNK